jgi:hypothetical protein
MLSTLLYLITTQIVGLYGRNPSILVTFLTLLSSNLFEEIYYVTIAAFSYTYLLKRMLFALLALHKLDQIGLRMPE